MQVGNRDRERDLDDSERMTQALAVLQEVRKRCFELWALNSTVWRTLHRDELAAYAKLNDFFEQYNAVPIALIASYSSKLLPSADNASTRTCVTQCVRGVSEMPNTLLIFNPGQLYDPPFSL
jgi:hypothetical protein